MSKKTLLSYIYILSLFLFPCYTNIHGEERIKEQGKPEFNRGVHFNQWFETTSVNSIHFQAYSKQDFINVKKMGANIIRLPLNLQAYASGKDFQFDDKFLTYLDKVVSYAEETEMYLILNNHTFYPDGMMYYQLENQLVKMWDQLSLRYKDNSDFILYQIANEPHDVDKKFWGELQQKLIEVIRNNDKKHTIIVNPGNWSSYTALKDLPEYKDDNLIYDFHFYDPMIFTHQNASFITPQTINLRDMPFPYNISRMPPFPNDLKGTGYEWAYNNYATIGTIEHLKSLIDIAIQFRNSRNVRIFCGELGVHGPGAQSKDRIIWYDAVCSYLRENDIPYTLWDYKKVFGIFSDTSNEVKKEFPDDLNFDLLPAIGFDDPRNNK